MTTSPDIKPRSRDVTDGLEKTAARGMLRAVGLGDDDFAKPQIGVASSWNEITPCNLSLDRLAKAVKDGVHAGGGYALPLHSGEWRNWQTRWLQVPVSVRTWGFKSPLAHHYHSLGDLPPRHRRSRRCRVKVVVAPLPRRLVAPSPRRATQG